jgi:hypothetical protein
MILGDKWKTIRVYFHKFDILIGITVVALVALFLWRHLKRESPPHAPTNS